jgi:hypothetical protein
MRFKLDESLGRRTQSLFEAEGHDCQTVRAESLQGAGDRGYASIRLMARRSNHRPAG